jgi:hypothetical protein
MRETFEVTVEVPKSGGRWVTVARWKNDAESVQTARWAADRLKGRAVISHTKAWTVTE